MSKHTQGPWVIDQEDLERDEDTICCIGIWAGDGDDRAMVGTVSAFGLHSEVIDGVQHFSPTEADDLCLDIAEANARLIAAAPDLLEALIGLDYAYCRAGCPLTREERTEDRKRLIAARAAIAKATGESK